MDIAATLRNAMQVNSLQGQTSRPLQENATK